MRIDTLVIGMDFSRAGIAAATWVTGSLAPRATIALIHAIEPPARPSFLVAETIAPAALEIDARAEWNDALRRFASTLGPRVVRAEVRIGRAADVITQFATDVGADGIVVGPHGNREHRSPLLGTTVDTLVRNADIPVIVGARADTRGRTRVIGAVTEGGLQQAVLGLGSKVARDLGGRLTLVHVVEPAAYSHMASMVAAHSHGDEKAEQLEREVILAGEARHWLTRVAGESGDASRVDAVAEVGVASEVILRYATKQRAALIVLGRHEGRPFGLPRLGRTVRDVLHASRCGVLVLPPS
jgi:nucleotide-binding universal stress UspA family protein